MTFPGFPIGLPPLPADAPELTAEHRAYVDGLLPHQRFEAEHSIRTIEAIFARAKVVRNPALKAAADLQDALRNESYREGLGMTEAKRAAEIHWQNKRDAA